MMSHASDEPEYETVIHIIRRWPTARRLSLVQEVLATLTPDESSLPQRSPTLHQALGLLDTGGPALSDSEIKLWLEERRQDRYGL